MVGKIGVICPVTGLQRAARYLLLIISIICLMKILSRSRVSKKSFLLNDVFFCALAIWAAVPFVFGTKTPVLGGQVKGLLGERWWYSEVVRTMPRYP